MTQQKAKALVSESSKAVAYELPIIQQNENIFVDARQLHRGLKSKQDYTDWIKKRIADYGLKQNEDFTINLGKSNGGRKAHQYLLTIDTAKELAMLERNEIGRTIRRYFIQKEKEARGISHLPSAAHLFKGIHPKRINNREMYPYREILTRCGYSAKSSSSNRKDRYWMHFIKDGNILFITKEFAMHMHHSRQVYINRSVMKASQPVLPLGFGDSSQLMLLPNA